MRLKVKVSVPHLKFRIDNERAVVEEMTKTAERLIMSRANSGRDARGQMPNPKTGGQPMRATGVLLSSVRSVVTTRGDQSKGVVKPTGARPKNENVKEKKAAAKEKTSQLRAAVMLSAFAQQFSGNAAKVRPRISRVKVRTADTNAALAGILSTEPKDKRGISGHRGIYRVFELEDDDTYRIRAAAGRTMKPRLNADGSEEIESG